MQNYSVKLKTFTLCAVVFSFALCAFRFPVYATENSLSSAITVSATIGEPKLTLFGYSSPEARVELRGQRVTEDAIANQQGYFYFDRVFLPQPQTLAIAGYPELCLTAVDTENRTSFPTCLPPLPNGPYEITVGPVLLPPTLSLSKGSFRPAEQATSQGSTLPNTEVTIFLAQETLTKLTTSRDLSKFWGSPAYAHSLPKYQIQSDENGHFEFNLPANWPSTWRVFASADYLGSPTPKSNTLTFRVLSWWQWLWEKILVFFRYLRPYFWELFILVEIILVIRLSKTYFHSLKQDTVVNSRFNQIISRRKSSQIKNRPT